MADNSFFVDTDKLATSLPGVEGLAQTVENIYSTLASTLESLGDCWGGPNDTTGKAFTSQYVPAANQMFDSMKDTKTALASMHDGVVTMAKGFAKTEETNAENSRKVAAQQPTAQMTRMSGGNPLSRQQPGTPANTGTGPQNLAAQPPTAQMTKASGGDPLSPRQPDVPAGPENGSGPQHRTAEPPTAQMTKASGGDPLSPREPDVPAGPENGSGPQHRTAEPPATAMTAEAGGDAPAPRHRDVPADPGDKPSANVAHAHHKSTAAPRKHHEGQQ